ncbi:hypothetical protein OS493_007386 [Desmophyllum pertusum]|uniref:Uncharacterized protein n=1 Tax=Desmophyllum pertusum TaxID=174260 RepID=A0A9W9Z3F2_9CNID|nr:hypothetical protein OS493_007386 [Desmophyllum pertusum]
MSNIMATAAFRFGHSQVNTHLWRFEEDGAMSHYGHLPLRDAYFSPERVSREGGIDPLLRGAVKQAAQEIDLKMVDDMRNVLFPAGREVGLDLASMNIQRGRDHGLPDYKLCEKGAWFNRITMRNFLKIRDGDRFWYESYLSKEEIDQVHSLTLSKIIRLNTGFKSVPDNVFFSTQYCAGVENFQCVPRDETPNGSCENLQRKLRTLGKDLENTSRAVRKNTR